MLRKEAKNEEKRQSIMMERPIMKKEELIKLVQNQKNGKAAGVDGIKAEMMKHMLKNNRIRKTLLRAFYLSLEDFYSQKQP